jgi:hypothetical protein
VAVRDRVARYIETADRLRVQAKQLADETLKSHYLKLAKQYEELAEDLGRDNPKRA